MLFDKLSSKDQDTIVSYINEFYRNPYSDIFRSNVSLRDRLAVWDSNKGEYLYHMLNDNFILERRVEFKEPPALLAQKISKACCFGNPMSKFLSEYRHWLGELPFEYWRREYQALNALVSADGLSRTNFGQAPNSDEYLPINIDFGEGKKIKLDATTKPMRALGKIVKMFGINEQNFEEFRLEHSRILNTKNITGTLCLSIHPMDYMTMSMNAENWRSCMNWSEPGGYRGGTIEVMNSMTTLVAYLKSDVNSFTWGGDSWNSKKWRLLVTVTPETIVSIKAYPYHHEELAKEVIDWVRSLAADNLSWFYGPVQKIPACSTFEYPDTNEWYNIDFQEGRLMYCDWACDTHYGCMTRNPESIGSSKSNSHFLRLEYCGPMTCMCCGKTDQDYYDESYVVCEDCCSYGEEDGCSCDHCGEWIPEGEGHWVGDECYCSDCIHEVAGCCQVSGDYFYDSDLKRVYLAKTADNPNDNDDSILIYTDYCTGRYRTTISDYYVNNISNPRQTDDGVYYFNREDLTENGFRWLYNLRDNDIAAYFEETD